MRERKGRLGNRRCCPPRRTAALGCGPSACGSTGSPPGTADRRRGLRSHRKSRLQGGYRYRRQRSGSAARHRGRWQDRTCGRRSGQSHVRVSAWSRGHRISRFASAQCFMPHVVCWQVCSPPLRKLVHLLDTPRQGLVRGSAATCTGADPGGTGLTTRPPEVDSPRDIVEILKYHAGHPRY